MKITLQILKSHLVAITFYLIYLWILITYYLRGLEYRRMLEQHDKNWHHGVREDGLGPFIFALIFGLIIGGFAIGAKENKFYLWLLAFIIIPIIILSNI